VGGSNGSGPWTQGGRVHGEVGKGKGKQCGSKRVLRKRGFRVEKTGGFGQEEGSRNRQNLGKPYPYLKPKGESYTCNQKGKTLKSEREKKAASV